MWKGFRAFIAKGNVLDLAVAVIIGGAFGKIVTSLVEDLLMPLVGIISGGIDLSGLNITVADATVKYGAFLQTVIDFLIVSFFIFLFVRLIAAAKNRFEKKEAEAAQAAVDKQEQLLEEIRDLLQGLSAKDE